MSVNRVQLRSHLSVKRVCFGKLQTTLCITFDIEVHPPGIFFCISSLKGILSYKTLGHALPYLLSPTSSLRRLSKIFLRKPSLTKWPKFQDAWISQHFKLLSKAKRLMFLQDQHRDQCPHCMSQPMNSNMYNTWRIDKKM